MSEPEARRVVVNRRGPRSTVSRVRPAPPTRDPVYVCACSAPAALGWQRQATEQELAAFVAEGRVATGESATVPVFGCAGHKLTGDAAARVHEAHCAAGALLPCDCVPRLVEVADPTFPKTKEKG